MASSTLTAGKIYARVIMGGGVVGGGIGVHSAIWDHLKHDPGFDYKTTPIILTMRCGHGILVGGTAGLLFGVLSPAMVTVGIPTAAVWWWHKR